MPEKPQGGPPQLGNRFGRSVAGMVIFAFVTMLLLFSFFGMNPQKRRELTINEFWTYVDSGQVVNELVVTDARIEGELSSETPGLAKGEPKKFFVNYAYKADRDFQQQLKAAYAKYPKFKAVYPPPSWWESFIPQLVVLLAVLFMAWFLLFRRLGAAGGGGGGFLGSFGRSRHRVTTKEHTRVTFNDVAGIDEAKEEVREIIEFLRNPRRFQRLGGRIPRGVLLVGEPGCGKTLLAKAIAGEAEVPFFSISGSDFVEMFVGVGASRVRDLFKQAKDSAPCIIFLDEIDAVGRRRGMGFNGGGHDEREQTLNAILVEMDGFDTSDQVIVIAATNRMDVLDPALTRPGRFDRQIDVPLPDLGGRVQILKIYVAKVRCSPDVDIQRLARGTPMFSGADLEAMVNEAAIAATMLNKEQVDQSDFEEARDKVRWGRSRKSRVIDEHEKEMTAYHEAGHALVQMLTPGADPLHKVSIIPRGSMGGATFSLPEKDRYMYTRQWCEAFIRISVAGRIAEQIFCGDVDSGAASDISAATELARRMVMDWGMSDKLGFVRYSPDPRKASFVETKEYSEKTAEMIDEEVKVIMANAERDTTAMIQSHRKEVGGIGQALLKYETLSGDEVRQIVDGKVLDKPTVGDLLNREQARTGKVEPAVEGPQGGVLPQPG
ncbi:MAG: ATP-dependent zinc metalloprotease FtsH [Phycisphaerae bacterium]|jgi:cell division protease FtsH